MNGDIFDPDPTGFFRAWTTDSEGKRVLVGLSVDETEWYIKYTKKSFKHRISKNFFPWSSVEEMHEEKEKYLMLHNKHEYARHQVLGAERELREKPTLQ